MPCGKIETWRQTPTYLTYASDAAVMDFGARYFPPERTKPQ